MKNQQILQLFSFLLLLAGCQSPEIPPEIGPYFGNGFRNGWADEESIVIWTRLTKTPEGNHSGYTFLGLTKEQHDSLRNISNQEVLHQAQIPEGLTLDSMQGACPGMAGEVRLTYHPRGNPTDLTQTDWKAVDINADFTKQFPLNQLTANTTYEVKLEARALDSDVITDEISGQFQTAPGPEILDSIRFVMVTCHDYNRKDHPDGHLIYPAMGALQPDFYVHGGDIEYYDKPNPYAMTEPMMRFKWNRLFSLPLQRSFFTQTTTYFMKDDHDALANDAYPGMTYGTVSYEKGLKIFDKEQFPSNDPTYKTIRWGRDLQIWIVEGRNYRSAHTMPDGPEKTIWGEQQKKWFYETVEASDATFKVLMASTPILGPDRKNKHDNYANTDFATEGAEVRAFIDQQENFFICNGDRHWQYVSHPEGTNLWEFSVGAGADQHAGGWKQEDVRPEHRFLRVKGGFLSGTVTNDGDRSILVFQHHDVHGNVVHEERFEVGHSPN